MYYIGKIVSAATWRYRLKLMTDRLIVLDCDGGIVHVFDYGLTTNLISHYMAHCASNISPRLLPITMFQIDVLGGYHEVYKCSAE